MDRYRILVVDDDATVRRMLGQFLASLAFEVAVAGSFDEAVRHMTDQPFDAILSDVRMPGADGIQLLEWTARNRPATATVMLSGYDDAKLAVQAMKAGASDYLLKPFDLLALRDTIGKAISKQREVSRRAEYLSDLEAKWAEQSGTLRHTVAQLQEATEETLEALAFALDARECETQAHSKRVSDYSVHLARELGVSGQELEDIHRGAMLHDIGKIGIPDRILLKPGRLTAAEWTEMRKHPEIGYWIVSGVDSLRAASDIVISHHERYDGTGYPRGVRGEQISIGARIFAVADTLDAILSERPYRTGQTLEHARREIADGAQTQFDPLITEAFLQVPDEQWLAIRERSFHGAARAEHAG